MTGSVFDIEEFAVYDGPGIRMVVFLKGCPLRCNWCHNPEGLRVGVQRITSHNLCIRCGACAAVCPSPGECTGCGQCVQVCPREAIHLAGTAMEAEAVAARIQAQAELLALNEGGVTFSGGEPLLQGDFVVEVCRLLRGVHKCIETSGYAKPEVFQRVIAEMDYVIMDLKAADDRIHREWTGVSNGPILENLKWLRQCGKPFRIRVPLIPTVNDSLENMQATARLIAGSPWLDKVELLPYHRAAGAKYASAGMQYQPRFPTDLEPQKHTRPFSDLGMEVTIL